VFYSIGALILWYVLLFPVFTYISRENKEHLYLELRYEMLTYMRTLSEYINFRLQEYELLLELQSDVPNFDSFSAILRKNVIRVQETKNVLLMNESFEITHSLTALGTVEMSVVHSLQREPRQLRGALHYFLYPFEKQVYLVIYRGRMVLILSSLQLLPEHSLFPHPIQWISLVDPKQEQKILYFFPSIESVSVEVEGAIKRVLGSSQGTGIEFSDTVLLGWDSVRNFPFKLLVAVNIQEVLIQTRRFTILLYVGGYSAATLLFFLGWLLALYKIRTLSQARELQIKEAILRETHHRIKNNIQTISSLLDLQQETVQDPEVKQYFSLAASRLRVIALLHEELYRQDSLHDIDIKEYCVHILAILSQLHDFQNKKISLQIEIDDDLFLDLKRAQSCGFLIHELVTNSLKHAFPDGKGGTIRVDIHRIGDTILLSVEDTGIGWQGNWEKSSGLGIVIIRSMAQQLNGTITMDGTSGMKVQVTFPVKV